MREKLEWRTKNIQVIKEIMWLLKKCGEANTQEEKEKYLIKISNWRECHPFEGEQLDKHLIILSKKKLFSLNRRKKITNVIKTS